MNVFISQPMRGRTIEEIKEERRNAIEFCMNTLGYDVTFINPYEYDNKICDPLEVLSNNIKNLAHADLVVFCHNWINYRGCRVEYYVAKNYNIATLDLDSMK